MGRGARAGSRLAAALVGVACGAAPAPAAVVDGPARFEVITPSLIRLEYSMDRRFADRRTLTTAGRLETEPRFKTFVRNGFRVIRTKRLTLRYRRGAGQFSHENLRLTLGGRELRPALGPNPAPLGGWRRSLDITDGPVPLHEGMLSREGWYLLDDSETVLLSRDGFRERPSPDGEYQDLYLFAYGSDYARGLRDLRTLTGPAPLLPRKAFGVWFSRWWPYGADDWKAIVERFREERVPLDTLSVDTDFKRVHEEVGSGIAAQVVGAPGEPYSWNGWDWNAELYPDPAGFVEWADDQGIDIGLNIHPSINNRDPHFAETQERAGGGLVASDTCRIVQADPQGMCMVFDWADPAQLDAYMALHEPFERDGIDFWWLDWCCDGTHADARGLTPDTWINKQYFDRQRARGERWPAFQRIGGSYQLGFGERSGNGAFAEHRYTLQFTGDTCGTWEQLAFASEFTAAAASIGMPYVSHDVGSFFSENPQGICSASVSPYVAGHENSLSPELYVRWVQLGAFQPLDRLHSHHGRRLPWEYEEPARSIAADFLRLRESLVPYLYTLARKAYDTGVTMVRPMYLHWPRHAAAYRHKSQYMLGRDLLVTPVAEPDDPAEVTVWFPPGVWVDWFTGKRHRGPATRKVSVPLDRMPVFARAGGIVAMQPPVKTTAVGPAAKLVLRAQRGDGRTVLYEDAGDGLEYERGRFTRTKVVQRVKGRTTMLSVGAARGAFPGASARRAYEVRFMGLAKPRTVTVAGRRVRSWRYDRGTRTLVVQTGRRVTDRAFSVVAGP